MIHNLDVVLVSVLQVRCLLQVNQVLFEDLWRQLAHLNAVFALLTAAPIGQLNVERQTESVLRVQTRHVLHHVLVTLWNLHNVVAEPLVAVI